MLTPDRINDEDSAGLGPVFAGCVAPGFCARAFSSGAFRVAIRVRHSRAFKVAPRALEVNFSQKDHFELRLDRK